MKYQPPVGGAANDPYVDASGSTEGSPVPAKAIEHPQRELDHLITALGGTPAEGDLTQVATLLLAYFLKSANPNAAGTMTISNGAEGLPGLVFSRPDTSPTVADFIGQLAFIGRDSGGNTTMYADILGRIVDPTNGSEDGEVVFRRYLAGVYSEVFCMRAGMYANGLSDPGAGAINATDLQINGVSLNVSAVPIGSIIYRSVVDIPTGYIKANGAAVSRTTYAALFALLSTGYGVGDGSTTFNVPDLRGLFIRSYHDGSGTYETDTGRTNGSVQADAFASHTHTLNADSAGSGGSGGDTGNTVTRTRTTNSTGGSETRPKNIALMALIKY
ncbi:MAG: Phage tail fiber protein [Rhodocyclales bacterium]|nr:Phage tail fiber protein [Rhodocyclales bacterium]